MKNTLAAFAFLASVGTAFAAPYNGNFYEDFITYTIGKQDEAKIGAFKAVFEKYMNGTVQWDNKTINNLMFKATASVVVVDTAEIQGVVPALNDPRHCRDEKMCFEQQAWDNLDQHNPNGKGFAEKGIRYVKMTMTAPDGRLLAHRYCWNLHSFQACKVEIEAAKKLKAFFEFTLARGGQNPDMSLPEQPMSVYYWNNDAIIQQ